MTVNEGTSPLTVGNVTVWPNSAYPNTAYPFAGTSVYTQSTYCSSETHVWACQHAEKCKCGNATRTIKPKLCPGCGKEHA